MTATKPGGLGFTRASCDTHEACDTCFFETAAHAALWKKIAIRHLQHAQGYRRA